MAHAWRGELSTDPTARIFVVVRRGSEIWEDSFLSPSGDVCGGVLLTGCLWYGAIGVSANLRITWAKDSPAGRPGSCAGVIHQVLYGRRERAHDATCHRRSDRCHRHFCTRYRTAELQVGAEKKGSPNRRMLSATDLPHRKSKSSNLESPLEKALDLSTSSSD